MALNFPDTPTVGQIFPNPASAGVPQWRWDGNEWVSIGFPAVADPGAVRFDSVQSLSTAQQKQARQNISVDNGVFYADRNGVAQTGLTAANYNKMSFNNKVKDANGWYDAVTNFRYTPQIAGSYFVMCAVDTLCGTSGETCQAVVRKNGVNVAVGAYISVTSMSTGTAFQSVAMTVVQMNGTTDYVEGWIVPPTAVTSTNPPNYQNYFTGYRVGD